MNSSTLEQMEQVRKEQERRALAAAEVKQATG